MVGLILLGFTGRLFLFDLRDRYGKTQLVFNENTFRDDFEIIKKFSQLKM